ncbi:hypothetical protein HOG48_05240 [Candidatus Peregrinibacteria bacterium]|jgi:hypothetical protein|nr:hypothetical protein [Candidatus Peregrinibacteria bacterium]
MHLTVNSDFVVFGKDPKKGFTTNFFYSWEDENPSHHSELYINFSIDGDDIDGEEFAQELFEVVRHEFFKNFDRDIHERFEETLNEVNKLSLEWREKKQIKFFSNIHAVIGILHGEELYLTQCGNAEGYLIRKRHLTVVSEGLSDHDKDRDSLFVNVANGKLEDYDTVIFTTSRLLRYVSKGELAKIFMRDSSLASSFSDLKHAVEMEIDHQINVLALNIINQKFEGDTIESKTGNSRSKSIFAGKIPTEKLKVVVANLKGKLGQYKKGAKGKGKCAIEKSAEELHVKTRPQHKKPILDIESLKDFSTFGKDKILISLVLVIVILVVGLSVVRAKAENHKRLTELETLLVQVQQDLDEASTRGTFDKDTAAELIDQAEDKIHKVLDSGEFRNKALLYKEEIKEARDMLDNIIRVEEYTQLADLTENDAEVNALGVLPLGDMLYAYEYDTVHPVMLDKLQASVTVDENEELIDGVHFKDQDSLLFLTKSHKIVEFADNFVKFMDTTDPAWKSAIAVDAYGPRVYLLDPSENRIWRYRRGREGYAGATEYSTEGDVTNAVDIAIDGSVYVLLNTGEIVKYYAGEIETDFYVVREPMVPVEKPTRIFTELEFNQVYVLEPTASRILIYNKDVKSGNLVYSHQYQFDSSFGVLKDMYVEKDSNKLYVLTESKIYQIEL